MKAVVAAFNQEKALVGAFAVITNLRMDLRLKLYTALTLNITEFRRKFAPQDDGEHLKYLNTVTLRRVGGVVMATLAI